MKLSQIGQDNIVEYNFVNPYTEQATDIFMSVHSVKSKHGKKAQHDMQLAILKLMQVEDNIIVDGDKRNLKPELIKEVSFSMLADLVVSWKGIEDDNGKATKFTKENCVKAFLECEELADGVYQFANEVGNFRKE